MNNPPRETDEAQGAQVYTDTSVSNDSPAGTPGTPGVRVYDRPETQQGPGMLGIILLIVGLIAVGLLVWNFMM